MKTTILIPTDFTIESLNLFKKAAQLVESESVNIVFLHCIYLSDSITELLFFSKKELIKSLVNPDFQDGCKIICNKYASRINSTRIEIFCGASQNAFNHFLEGNLIDEIIVPENYSLRLVHKRSFDPMPFIQHASVPVKTVTWPNTAGAPEKNHLAELFLSQHKS
jgi:hypothetical protein